MQYLLLCCFDEKQWEAIPESQRDTIMREYGELRESLDVGGVGLRVSSPASPAGQHREIR